jgi:hypothetical protein
MEGIFHGGRELSAEEHRRAQEIAYFIAMKRGDGKEPPYDPLLAERDFCQAAGQLTAKRSFMDVILNSF